MAHNLYPLTFHTLLRAYDYGDRRIAEYFQRDLPPGIVAETWELSDHPGNRAVISNGALAGRTLHSLIAEMGADLLGERVVRSSGLRFPLLLKFLDVAHYLGVQIHPDDAAATRLRLAESGKSEAWSTVWAAPGATAYWGLKPGVSKEMMSAAIDRLLPFEEIARRPRMAQAELEAALARDPVMSLLRPVQLEAGDMLYVPPGWVHACGPGVLIFEVQQNADVTMVPQRTYTGGQGRDVTDVKQAREMFLRELAVADVAPGQEKIAPVIVREGAVREAVNERRYLIASRYFALEEWRLHRPWTVASQRDRFSALTAIEGEGVIDYAGGQEEYRAGHTMMIPAAMGAYRLLPRQPSRLLCSYLPDLAADIVAPLRAADCPDAAIAALGGPPHANDLLPLLSR